MSRRTPSAEAVHIPTGVEEAELEVGGAQVKLTHLDKPFWPDEGITKRDLLQYYADASPWLLPHLRDRPMTLKRYPDGAFGKFFFAKNAPKPRPRWLALCPVEHADSKTVVYPLIQDTASLLWAINLGCIDLNPSYAVCGDIDRPDFLNFDLDPVPGATFDTVREAALLVHAGLDALKLPSFAKTTGSRGIHIYVPLQRGLTQKVVWSFAKHFALALVKRAPDLVTAVYTKAKRPAGRVLIDFHQNQWGRTLASVYSVRPVKRAAVSMPVTWEEISRGIEIAQFRLDNAVERLQRVGDLWAPLLAQEGRVDLARFGPQAVS
jgi:bifunctional non-homologous end joining protein LigD